MLLVTGFRPAEARTVAQTETFQTIVTLTDTTVASQPVPVQRPLGVSALMAEIEMEEVDLGDSIVARAMKHIGARYRYGHTGPKTFDCSGFTSYVFGKEDIKLSRTSRSQFREGSVVKRIADLQAGDLVFFGGRRSARSVGHVGIVTEVNPENNTFKFVHASNSGVKVDESTSSYYKRRYIGARLEQLDKFVLDLVEPDRILVPVDVVREVVSVPPMLYGYAHRRLDRRHHDGNHISHDTVAALRGAVVVSGRQGRAEHRRCGGRQSRRGAVRRRNFHQATIVQELCIPHTGELCSPIDGSRVRFPEHGQQSCPRLWRIRNHLDRRRAP